MRQRYHSGFALLLALAVPSMAWADPALRIQVDQRGDFLTFGNSSGFECRGPESRAETPVVGTATCTGVSGANDSSPDIFWRSEADGSVVADSSISAAEARTTAMLKLPAGAEVTYARIYWAGYRPASDGADDAVGFGRPGGFGQTVEADDSFTAPSSQGIWYQSTADITALVQENGAGAYSVDNIASVELSTVDNNDPMVAWTVVVLYRLDSEPPRNLALFDGLDDVATNTPAEVTIEGFLVPSAGFDAKLGVITYEGEQSLSGDRLAFNGVDLSDAVNPINNFFNSSRSYLGQPVSVEGDLPQLSGLANSMSGVDVDVVDVSARLQAGDTRATIRASSTADRFLLGAFVTSISTFRPDFQSSTKSFVDVNGGAVRPGDVLQYSIVAVNEGNDSSVNTVLIDPLPEGLEYVAGSLSIADGAGAGALSDDEGDDLGEYDAATRTLTVRIGAGADATQGGVLEVGESSTVTFRARLAQDATGVIRNQANITAEGELGAPSATYPTDGNGQGDGAPPTETVVGCASDDACSSAAPFCDDSATPAACVGCRDDADCTLTAAPDCLEDTQVCGCAAGEGACGTDSDGDGLSDEDEGQLGTDPQDADSDDDGVPDGAEPKPGDDSDGDGLINALDPDSDNDGLFDGTELGLGCDGEGTAQGSKRCKADADEGATTTDPLNPDTDGGGVRDGSEDFNLDGAVDDGEGDPLDATDDADVVDSDGDGISDGTEKALGTDPEDGDSDDDGVPDGQEPNPSDDSDGDGLINALDPDSDGDGLFDGTEMGLDCSAEGTDAEAGSCIADADGGATTTSPLNPDTDGGGVGDGVEDANKNGAIDAGEGDPNDPADDRNGVVGGALEGGGCSCQVGPAPLGTLGAWALALGLGAVAGLRRRGRRSAR